MEVKYFNNLMFYTVFFVQKLFRKACEVFFFLGKQFILFWVMINQNILNRSKQKLVAQYYWGISKLYVTRILHSMLKLSIKLFFNLNFLLREVHMQSEFLQPKHFSVLNYNSRSDIWNKFKLQKDCDVQTIVTFRVLREQIEIICGNKIDTNCKEM